ncbi:MAG TPA: TRAP transporter large permease subunit [Alphaproteobacteria bacterium]|nr:TRAP transporter large permease subunit [Alphaproteobacteria bacterium]
MTDADNQRDGAASEDAVGAARLQAVPRYAALRASARSLDALLEIGCIVLLAGTTVVAVTQVYFRYVENASLSWPEEVARWAFVWLVFVGMAIGVHRKSHIAIDIVSRRLPERWRPFHDFLIKMVTAATAIMLVVHGSDLVSRSTYVSPAMEWPFLYLYAAVPVGGALTLFYLGRQRIEGSSLPLGGIAAVLAGLALYLAYRHFGAEFIGTDNTALVLVVFALVLILAGVPVAFSLAFGAFAAFAPTGDLLLLTISQNMTAALDSFILLSIPFFILAAAMMNVGGITERLIEFATRLVGHLRGGLGHVNVLTNTMLAGVSGSSMADAAAIAKSLVPEMEKHGYSRAFSCALTASGGVLANLIPPSLGLIVYGALAQTSVGALFVASIVPGILLALALAATVHVVAVKRGFGADTERSTGRQRITSAVVAVPALLLPALIVGGVRFGVFTASEAGAIAVFYALICGLLIYRRMTGRNLVAAFREAFSDTVAVMVIIAAAKPFAWVLATERIPQTIAASLADAASDPFILLLLLNVFLLLTGLIMEMIAAMVILVPIFIPIITAAGISPVHFGVIIVMNLVIGSLTPPLGMLAFATARVGGANITDVFRALMPFLIVLIFVLMVVTFVPALSLGLTRLIGP